MLTMDRRSHPGFRDVRACRVRTITHVLRMCPARTLPR